MTFDYLCQLEPRLAELHREALSTIAMSEQQVMALFFGYKKNDFGFKARLVKLVGMFAEGDHPDLHTSKAYDVAYNAILMALG